jgi:hypothetical protein
MSWFPPHGTDVTNRVVFLEGYVILKLIEPPKAMRVSVSSNRGVAFLWGLCNDTPPL